jgi:hypothetical protein
MSLIRSIIAGDREPMGFRAARVVEAFEASGTIIRARINDRDQDIVQIWVDGSSQNFVRAQVLFDDPNRDWRISRPIGQCARKLADLFEESNFHYRVTKGSVDVIEIDDVNGDRLLLDPYLAHINERVY